MHPNRYGTLLPLADRYKPTPDGECAACAQVRPHTHTAWTVPFSTTALITT